MASEYGFPERRKNKNDKRSKARRGYKKGGVNRTKGKMSNNSKKEK